MINLICFNTWETDIDFYFHHDKNTFIHSDKADLSDENFWTESVNIPEYIFEIAMNEFKTDEKLTNDCLSVVVSEF